jgi:hypothetical protein
VAQIRVPVAVALLALAGCGGTSQLAPSATANAAVTSPGAARESVLHFFSGRPDGALPNVGRLVFDRAGNLYGATNTGGSGTCKFRGVVTGCGVVFELLRARNGNWHERVLYSFKNLKDGAGPYSTLTIDRAGNIYGVTMAGGNSGCVPLFWVYRGCGTAFELTHGGAGWKKRIIHVFSGGIDGGNPVAGLVLDSAGNLYGTAYCGGVYSCYTRGAGSGVFFMLQNDGNGAWRENVLHIFGIAHGDGAYPIGDLTPKGARTIYGTTGGSVYEMTRTPKSQWRETTLFLFGSSSPTGYLARGGIVFDAAGNLYGTTYGGGNFHCTPGCGVVFELTPSASGGWSETVLHTFTGGSDGALPDAGLAMDSYGRLDGTTANGGDLRCNNGGGCGVVFRVQPMGRASTEEVLHTFEGGATDGELPQSAVTLDGAGHIYGSTQYGGPGSSLGKGIAFRVAAPLR